MALFFFFFFFQAKTGSPQSTLSGFGSWSAWSSVSSDGSPNGPSQAPSPPVTPFGSDDNTWDLIYAAAKQVARLKVNSSRDGVIGPSQSSSNLVSSVKDVGFYSHASQVKFISFGFSLPCSLFCCVFLYEVVRLCFLFSSVSVRNRASDS